MALMEWDKSLVGALSADRAFYDACRPIPWVEEVRRASDRDVQLAMNRQWSRGTSHTPNTSWNSLLQRAKEKRVMQAMKADEDALREKRRALMANDGWA